MDITQLSVFLSATFLIVIMPGPAVFYVITRSIDEGKKAGFLATLGLGVGAIFHVLLAVFGLSAILASSPVAFSIVRIIGALYLFYIGIAKLREKGSVDLDLGTKSLK